MFGVGPAGTGKTYLAMAQAVSFLLSKRVSRIILARPAVEAGEKLGFLPGDLQEKVNPYLRPLYDALYDMLEGDRVERLLERGTIEIAPIAFMRGRTLNDAFVILDEAQNTTSEQMKMFLTRLGFGSKAVITGDVTQIDLPHGRVSGLIEALNVVRHVEGIAFIHFDDRDVVRHKLVQKIVLAYAEFTAGARRPRHAAARVRGRESFLEMGSMLRKGSRPRLVRVGVRRPRPTCPGAGTRRVADGSRPARDPGHRHHRAGERRRGAPAEPPLARRRSRHRRAVVLRTFPTSDGQPCRLPGRAHLGDIVIATGVAARQAPGRGHALRLELRVLALHGFLHLVGYDHDRDAGEMARIETAVAPTRRPGGGIDRAGARDRPAASLNIA